MLVSSSLKEVVAVGGVMIGAFSSILFDSSTVIVVVNI